MLLVIYLDINITFLGEVLKTGLGSAAEHDDKEVLGGFKEVLGEFKN